MQVDNRQPRARMEVRALYSGSISQFLAANDGQILGALTASSNYSVETTQRDAWVEQIAVLRSTLAPYQNEGYVAFEYEVPRVGRRIDVLALIRHVIFVMEFKVGEDRFTADATNQVWDYALDLKNFHSSSHNKPIVPILIATRAAAANARITAISDQDGVLRPLHACPAELGAVLNHALAACEGSAIDIDEWAQGWYAPTPTIIDAALALYGGHGVEAISRSDAAAVNLSKTSGAIAEIIRASREHKRKTICFVTGVPGAGKTLVGLNTATSHMDTADDLHSVFLSGNGPLVAVLREALARDQVLRSGIRGRDRLRLVRARSEVKAFIQNVHHFRDECLINPKQAPIEHVVLFDEAQRAWNLERTAAFMLRKKQRPGFSMSEPEFLVSCMDRHQDWAVIVCLVGGGQEINTGEAGIGEWIRAMVESFPSWWVYLSPGLHESEFASGRALEALQKRSYVHFDQRLHLDVSMRSFRAERLSTLVKKVLDLEVENARSLYDAIKHCYPIMLTRSIRKAKAWLKSKARGNERYGMVASSQAQRLKPHAIDVCSPVDPVHWFLDPREDVRSSFYLEDVATEFHVQGLELDWACVVWDADFRHSDHGWQHWSFRGNRWQCIRSAERQGYLKNAYRVLLTRARQGMVIVVPKGDSEDPTRSCEYYDSTFEYLRSVGLLVIE